MRDGKKCDGIFLAWPQLFKDRITLSVDKSLSNSFNLCKDFSISLCISEYAHSNHSYVWECVKTLDNV